MSPDTARKILGVTKNAPAQEIKKAYRKLASKYHPDRHLQNPLQAKQAVDKMQRINIAYSTLSQTAPQKNSPPQEPEEQKPQEDSAAGKGLKKVLAWWGFILLIAIVMSIAMGLFLTEKTEKKSMADGDMVHVEENNVSPAPPLFTVDTFNTIQPAQRVTIQRALSSLGYNLGESDGVFGSRTMAAIHSFCRDFSFAKNITTPEIFTAQLDFFTPLGQEYTNLVKIVTSSSFTSWFLKQQQTGSLPSPMNMVSILDSYIFATQSPGSKKMPPTEILWQNETLARDRNLDIKNTTQQPYYYKVTSLNSDKEVMYGFIQPFESSTIAISEDTCIVKLASGTTWYGKEYLFGPKTMIREAQIASGKQKVQLILDNKPQQSPEVLERRSIYNF